MGAAAAVVFLLGRRLAADVCAADGWPLAGPFAAAVLFAVAPVTRVYAGTTNVDALALLAALLALLALLHGRWASAGAALALAVALKDPHVVLVPVVLGGAAWCGGRRALVRAALVSAAVYAVASGALTGPGVWREHVAYLAGGGVEGVDRIDHGELAAWGRLLLRTWGLVFGGWGAAFVWVFIAGRRLDRAARRGLVLVLLSALAPRAALRVCRSDSSTRDSCCRRWPFALAVFGASAARGLAAAADFAPMIRVPAAILLLALVGTLATLHVFATRDVGDARADVVGEPTASHPMAAACCSSRTRSSTARRWTRRAGRSTRAASTRSGPHWPRCATRRRSSGRTSCW